MEKKIRFHLDENAHNAIAEGLRRRCIDVTTTLKAGLISVLVKTILGLIYLIVLNLNYLKNKNND